MAESLNFQKKKAASARVLRARVRPRHLELALGLLYQLDITTVTHQRSRGYFGLEAKMPPHPSPGFLLRRLAGLRTLTKGEKIFFDIRIKTFKTAPWASSHLRYLRPMVLKAPSAVPSFPSVLRIDPRGGQSKAPRQDTLVLDSSLAFGTGAHPTTQMAAELLWEALIQSEKNGRVLDVGCGTGILAMIAKKLTGGQVTAVENDPIALDVARENLSRNGLSVVLLNDLKKAKGRFSVIVANILLSALTEMKKDLAKRLNPEGFLILSGLLYRDVPSLKRAYGGFRMIRRKNRKGWTALLLKRK